MYRQMTPVSALLDPATWPGDFLSSDRGDSLLDSLYIVDYSLLVSPDASLDASLRCALRVVFEGELALSLPGLDGVSLVVGVPQVPLTPVQPAPPPEDEGPPPSQDDPPDLGDSGFVYAPNLDAGWTEVALSLQAGEAGWSLTLQDVSFELRFADTLLRPADGSEAVRIAMRGDVTVDDAWEIIFSGGDDFDLSRCEVGRTGLLLEATGVTLDLSRMESPPEVLGAGFDAGFLGLALQSGTVQLPEWLTSADGEPVSLTVTGGVIGSGGFGGRLTLDGGPLAARLFGFGFALRSADLTFVQNVVTAGAIEGALSLPFFEAEVGVSVGFGPDGGVQVAITDVSLNTEGLLSIPLGPLGAVQLSSLQVDVAGGVPAIEIGGALVPGNLGGVSLPVVSLDGLRLAADGTVAVEGAGLTLQDQAVVDLYGFQLEVTAVTVGSETRAGRPWNAFGFSGGLHLGDFFPVAVSAGGFRVLCERGGSGLAFEADGFGAAFGIEDVVALEGSLSLVGQEFRGAIKLALPALDLAVDASLIVGRTTGADPYIYAKVELDASLPLGIPLGCTGLALYGLSGLFALNMTPDQEGGQPTGSEFDWYADWFLAWDEPWREQRGAMGFGAGVTVGTLADNGYTFATSVALVFSFPGPIIMLQGVGNILRPRSSLPDESTFTSLILFDGAGGELLAALGMEYRLPADGPLAGTLLDAGGTAEAAFDLDDAANWHIYLGQSPPEERIRAQTLSLFQADAYLTLEQPRLEAGASISYDAGFDFEVVEVTLRASLSGTAGLSWTPQHLSASLTFEGEIALRAFAFSLGIRVEAEVAAEAPTPFRLTLDVTVSISLPWPLSDLEVPLQTEWKEEAEPEAIAPLQDAAAVRAALSTASWALTLTADPNLDNEARFYPTLEGQVVEVPMDSRPVLVFNRNLEDVAGLGTPRPVVQPEVVNSAANGSHEFRYRLTGAILQRWAEGPSGALEWTGIADVVDPASESGATVKGLPVYGSWQATGDGAGTQLELYGDGPFSFCRDNLSTGSGDPASAPPWTPYVDGFLSTHPDFPQASVDELRVTFWPYLPGQNLGTRFVHQGLTFACEEDLVVRDLSLAGGDKCLALSRHVSLYITFPAPVSRLVLTLHSIVLPGGHVPTTARWALVRGTLSGGGSVLETVDLGESDSENTMHQVALGGRFSAVTGLEVRGLNAYLIALSYVTTAQLEAVDDLVADGERQLGVRPLFLPSSDYRLTVRTETVASTSAGTTSELRYAYFRTAGPPASLTPYVATTVPASGGGVLGAGQQTGPPSGGPGGGPHFGTYDLRVECNRNYVREMYGGDLSVEIRDENGTLVRDASGAPLMTLRHTWTAATVPYTTGAWLDALSGAGLLGAPATESTPPVQTLPVPDDVLTARLTGATPLPPARRLEGRLVYRGDSVLTLPFHTSRYADFSALIADFTPGAWNESCPLEVPSGATVDQRLAELASAAGVWVGGGGRRRVSAALDTDSPVRVVRRRPGGGVEPAGRVGTAGAFTAAEGDLTEHLLYGVLGSPTRPLPQRPQATALRLEGEAVALLLELPEPLEWVRLSLQVAEAGGARRALPYAVLRGHDQQRIMLLRPPARGEPCPQPWAAGKLSLTFSYLLDPGDGTLPVLSRRGSTLPEAPPAVLLALRDPS